MGLQKLCRIVNTSSPVCKWNHAGDTIIISSPDEMSEKVLSKYFKSSNFHSFVRQLHFYGFRKTDKDKTSWEFRHQYFQRDREDLLTKIARRTSSDDSNNSAQSSIDALNVRVGTLERQIERQNRTLSLAFSVLNRIVAESSVSALLIPEVKRLVHESMRQQSEADAAYDLVDAARQNGSSSGSSSSSSSGATSNNEDNHGAWQVNDSLDKMLNLRTKYSLSSHRTEDIVNYAVEHLIQNSGSSNPQHNASQSDSKHGDFGDGGGSRKRKASTLDEKMIPASEVKNLLSEVLQSAAGGSGGLGVGSRYGGQKRMQGTKSGGYHLSGRPSMPTQSSESRMLATTSFSYPDVSWSGGLPGMLSGSLCRIGQANGSSSQGRQFPPSLSSSQISGELVDVVDRERSDFNQWGIDS